MTRSDISDIIYTNLRGQGITRKQAADTAEAIVEGIRSSLIDGDSLSLRGLFTITPDHTQRVITVSLPTVTANGGAPRVVKMRSRLRIRTSSEFRDSLTEA